MSNANRVYLGSFDSWKDLIREFTGPDKMREPARVWAEYDHGGYDGSAVVVYKIGRKVYVNEGGHCSCYGLEDQWSPTEYASVKEFEACSRKATYGQIKDNLPAILTTLR